MAGRVAAVMAGRQAQKGVPEVNYVRVGGRRFNSVEFVVLEDGVEWATNEAWEDVRRTCKRTLRVEP